MTQNRQAPEDGDHKSLYQHRIASSHYGLLGVHPSASVREVRQAYRELSKQYHPDTTSLPADQATQKFQQLNEAYATLSSPERRLAYDHKIGYSRVSVVQPLPNLSRTAPTRSSYTSSAYLDPTDRPLSAGEVFALFILGLTFLACLVLAITIGLTKGEEVFQPLAVQTLPIQQVASPEAASSQSSLLIPQTLPAPMDLTPVGPETLGPASVHQSSSSQRPSETTAPETTVKTLAPEPAGLETLPATEPMPVTKPPSFTAPTFTE